MLTKIFAFTVQTAQLFNQLCGIHKAQIHPLPGQRMNGMRRIAHQRQTVRRELTRIATGKREHLPFAFKRTQPQTLIESNAQRLVKLFRRSFLHLLRFFRHQRPDNGAQVRVGKRQDFYWTLHSVFVTRHEQTQVFDTAFRIFWRRRGFIEKLLAEMSPIASIARRTAKPPSTRPMPARM
mgnify:CR=1 FL=1